MQRALSLRSHIICHGEVPAATVTTDLAHDVLEAEFLVRVLQNLTNVPKKVSVRKYVPSFNVRCQERISPHQLLEISFLDCSHLDSYVHIYIPPPPSFFGVFFSVLVLMLPYMFLSSLWKEGSRGKRNALCYKQSFSHRCVKIYFSQSYFLSIFSEVLSIPNHPVYEFLYCVCEVLVCSIVLSQRCSQK